ncbi:hypothetical protein, partial [Pseudomonas sp. DE0010]|uniref:hypothetical protein n=1 Tax=Pseudomonas sp. DE0010 TaxID=2584951 RepID=UPI001C49BA3D
NEYQLAVCAHAFKFQVSSFKFQVSSLKFEVDCVGVGVEKEHSPFAMATLSHLFALTASHFLSNATKSN